MSAEEKEQALSRKEISFLLNPQDSSKYRNLLKRFCHNFELCASTDELRKILYDMYKFLENEKGHLSKDEIIDEIRKDIQGERLEPPETLLKRLKDWP